MMKLNHLIWLILLSGSAVSFSGLAQPKDESAALAEIRKHRQEQNDEMRADDSPLLKKDKRKFKGLKYFEPNLDYRVDAKFVKTGDPTLFKMKTTTTRLPEYSVYGVLHFNLLGTAFTLNVYRSPEVNSKPGYEDYLFVPFTDLTNGNETYDVGRYLEMRIPEGDSVVIDFNLAYNPYCSYNPGYSCPIPPKVNHLPVEIRAGEKKFKDH